MTDHTELKRLAEAFPADLDWDSNTEPFFNGPSGESLGGGATGFYSVYGKPFRLEGEDYDYDGPTYVEACNSDFAKFMVAAREGVLALIAENEEFKAVAAQPASLNASPSVEYEGLKRQFFALRNYALCKDKLAGYYSRELENMRQVDRSLSAGEIDAERNINEQLTNDLLSAEAVIEKLLAALKVAETAMWKAESNMDNEAADIRDLLKSLSKEPSNG